MNFLTMTPVAIKILWAPTSDVVTLFPLYFVTGDRPEGEALAVRNRERHPNSDATKERKVS